MLKGLKLSQRYNNSISFRYLSIVSIFLFTIQLVFGASSSYRLYQQKINYLEEKAKTKLKFLSTLAPEAILSSDTITLEKLLQDNNQDRDIIYGVIIDNNSQSIAQAISTDKAIVNQLAKQEYPTEDINIIPLLKAHNSIIEISNPIQSEDEQLGEIRIGYSWQTANEELIKAGLYNLYSAVLISSLLIGLTIIIFNRQILKPIQKLQQLAQAIAAGKLDARVEVEREDELGKLSSALNDYLFIRKSFISHC
ncbi:MAG: HAMP domain-containing protein [Xenococcaceae cyanobacterium MO_207.B15]|nr:HAMP domain-containing protein [Xenococcaceae cyanobacterium MO_207.B15]